MTMELRYFKHLLEDYETYNANISGASLQAGLGRGGNPKDVDYVKNHDKSKRRKKKKSIEDKTNIEDRDIKKLINPQISGSNTQAGLGRSCIPSNIGHILFEY